MNRSIAPVLLGLAAVGVVVAVGVGMLGEDGDLFPTSEECVAEVDGHRVELSPEQSENASLITAISVRRGLPARAASIALATAYQESDLFNLEQGDRDSVGLFQQRPSQGWGSAEQILDPVYATNAFYDALLGIEGYESMEITVAAQAVQRSGFPDAYADHEADARAIASALTGHSPGGFTCTVSDDVEEDEPGLNGRGLTARADAVRREALGVFGAVRLRPDGRAVDILLRPVTEASTVRGWAMAQYFVAQAGRLHVQTVIFDDRIWTADDSDDGWREYDPPSGGSRHRDHVHVDVFA